MVGEECLEGGVKSAVELAVRREGMRQERGWEAQAVGYEQLEVVVRESSLLG